MTNKTESTFFMVLAVGMLVGLAAWVWLFGGAERMREDRINLMREAIRREAAEHRR